jgi:hemolysin III
MEVRTVSTTIPEEIACCVTHGIGALLSMAGLTLLVTLAILQGEFVHVASCAVYGSTLVMLYLTSTLYHTFQAPAIKHLFRVLDHICVYLLIAGSYTPFALVNMRETWGWYLFFVMWGVAGAGTVFKIFYTGHYTVLSTLGYVAMGWVAVFALEPIVRSLPLGGVILLSLGGLSYTFGLIFFAWERLPYNHAIWHLFVLAGSAFHFLAVFWYVLPW